MSVPRKRRYRAVFFDLIGTLTSNDSDDEAHQFATEAMVERYRIVTEPILLLHNFNARLRRSFADAPTGWPSHKQEVKKAFSAILNEHRIEPGPDGEDWFYHEYLKKHQTYVRLRDGAMDLLGASSKLNIHLGIISNLDREYMDLQLKWLDLSGSFQSATCAEDVGARKPDGKIFQAALAKAECEPEQAIMVGDSVERDIEGAKALGMTTVLVDTKMAYTELKSADFIASNLSRAGNILTELFNPP